MAASQSAAMLESRKPALDSPAGESLVLRFALILLYFAAGAWLIWLSRDQINPDGVAYIQHARHWAAGRFDLAVTSWWGPLLSWLLVPAVWLGWNEVLVVKIIGAACGALTAIAAGRIANLLSWYDGRLACRNADDPSRLPESQPSSPAGTFAFAATLALCLLMLAEPVTPDVLLTCIISWYFLLTLRWLTLGRTRDIVLAGLLGGVGYLAKSYALPFVIVHLVLTVWMRGRRVRLGLTSGPTVRPAIHALAMLAAVALPWIVTLSYQAHSPTIGCAGQYARRAFDPVALQRYPDLPIFDLQRPRDGRLTCWENGLETQRAWPDWKVLCPQGIKRVAYSTFLNVQRTLDFLNSADRFGLMRISLVILAACCLLRLVRGPAMWTVASALVFSAGYLPLIVYDRYLWPAWPMQLAVLASILLSFRPARAMPDYADRWRLFLPWAGKVAVFFVLLSLVWADILMVHKWSGPDGEGARYAYLRSVGSEIARQGDMPVASNEWHQGLFGAFWAERTYLGQFRGTSAGEVAAELAPFGQTCLIVFDDPALSDELECSPIFRRVELPRPGEAWQSDRPRIAAFMFRPDRMITK